MNEAVIEDLKQFIAVTVSQATADMATNEFVKAIVNNEVNGLRHDMNKGFVEVQLAVADTITVNNDDIDARFANHEKRIRRLERRNPR